MKKLFLTLMLCCGFAFAAQAQLLYKISGNGLTEPSYIIGSQHLVNVSFVNEIPGIKTAMNSTQQVCGEVKMDPSSMMEMQSKLMKYMMLDDGMTIDSVLSEDQMKRVNAFMKEIMFTDFTNPAVMQQMGNLKPTALSANFTVLIYMLRHQGEFDPTSSFDAYFQTEAVKENKPVMGLETPELQAELLYGDSLSEQVKDLMCLIDNKDFEVQQMEALCKAYKEQDTTAIWNAYETKMNNDCDSDPETDEKLIFSRNRDWVGKMPEIMQEKPTLFCVGCLHLLSDKGVLALLRKAGYTVEAVK